MKGFTVKFLNAVVAVLYLCCCQHLAYVRTVGECLLGVCCRVRCLLTEMELQSKDKTVGETSRCTVISKTWNRQNVLVKPLMVSAISHGCGNKQRRELIRGLCILHTWRKMCKDTKSLGRLRMRKLGLCLFASQERGRRYMRAFFFLIFGSFPQEEENSVYVFTMENSGSVLNLLL